MDFSYLINNAAFVFLLVGLVLVAIGLRVGRFRAEGDRVVRATPRWAFVWAGVAVMALGAIFGLVLAIAVGDAFGAVLSVVQLGIYGYIIFMLTRIQRRLRAGSAG